MKKNLILVILLAFPAFSSFGTEWRDIGPGDAVRIPEHLYFQKNYRIQWWYITGHLFDASGREFGYELTFFAAGVQQRKYESRFGVDYIYLSHFAVTDVAGNRFYHFSSADGGAYGFSGADADRLKVRVDRSFLDGSIQRMHLRGQAGDLSLDLSLLFEKPAVLHGDDGYSRKSSASPLAASLYFSLTDLRTSGNLRIGDKTFPVTGTSWFDREISSRGLAGNEAGWDWFAVQLDDGRQIMLYRIRTRGGGVDPFSSGTIIYNDGTSRHIRLDDYMVKEADHYTSPHTGARYPSKWEVTIASENLAFTITPLVRDQEFTEGGLIRKVYWEGTCRVEGSVNGRAYVELTGYEENQEGKIRD